VAIDERVGEVYAVGTEAERMIGRTPAAISATRPLRHGVIADFEVTEQMLRQFIAKVVRSRWAHPRLVMCAPSGVTEVERRAMQEASLSAGARQVHLIEEPLAAAIGAGVSIAEPVGRMIVDVGGGTSEVAVISLGGIVVSRSVRVGGYDLDEAIGAHIRNAHRMAIGSRSAEAIKLEIGSAAALTPEVEAEVRGRDLLSGLPRELRLGSAEVRAERSTVRCRRSSQRCRRRWRRRRRSWRAISSGTASCWPAAAPSYTRSPSGSTPRPGCRCTWPSHRLAAWRWARGTPLRSSTFSRGQGRQPGGRVIARSLTAPLWPPGRVGARPRPHSRDRSNGTLHARQGQPAPAPR